MVFLLAKRQMRTQRGNGIPHGIVTNLEELQQAIVGLAAATVQEREEEAQARLQAETMQGAVNALQMQMAGVILPNEATINAVA